MLLSIILTILPSVFAQITGDASSPTRQDPDRPVPTATIYPDTSSGQPIEVTGVGYGALDYYLGIPYAVPPEGDLRWTRPTSPVYTSSINATGCKSACIQPDDVGGFGSIAGAYGTSEDCLYLNVVTPRGGLSNTWAPVLVFIPGGGYQGGSTSTYDPSGLLVNGINSPVVFVSISYRVGILGFPVDEDLVQAGAANLGLRDVILALEWVKTNIWAFGGDANRVTVSGQSAGAGITSFLYLVPGLDLFRSGIIMSGSPTLGNFAPGTTSLSTNASAALLDFVDCDASDSNSSIVDCLKEVDAERLLEAQTNISDTLGTTQLFGPITDYNLLPDDPYKLIPAGAFARKPLLIGDTLDEGTFFTDPNITVEGFKLQVTGGDNPTETREYAEKIFELYPPDPKEGSPFGTGNETFGATATFKRSAAYIGDSIFQAGRRQFVRELAKTGTQVWGYESQQPPPVGLLPASAGGSCASALCIPPYAGVFHGSDVGYLLGLFPTYGVNHTAHEEAFIREFQTYWLNFVTNTDPNVGTSEISDRSLTYWPQYGPDSAILGIVADHFAVAADTYREEAMSLLTQSASAGVA